MYCASPGGIISSTRTKYVSCSALVTLITDLYGADIISVQRVTIESLPDNVLLNIFDFYRLPPYSEWFKLVHACRRWRYIVFESPHRLDLQLECKGTTPVMEMLNIWPRLPISIADWEPTHLGGDNIIAALHHSDRVCEINIFHLTDSLLERLATVMQEQFPVLEYLDLRYFGFYYGMRLPVLPETFLGGFTPRLKSLHPSDIPFPALPKLVLSARDLVSLSLFRVSHPGYISPEAVATCMSALTKLKLFFLPSNSNPYLPAPI